MIYQYIKELIENNNRIIIPDFGAFMIQNSPEGKQISFNDFLKFNDGLLINQVIKSEKISKSQAADAIKAFVNDIEQAFAAGKPFEVIGVGFLVKDDHGNIKFESNLSESSATPVSKPITAPEVVSETKEPEPTKEPEILATDSTPIIQLDETSPEVKKEETPKTEEKVEPLVVEKDETKPESSTTNDIPEVKAEESKPAESEKTNAEESKAEIKPRAIPEKPKMAIPSKPAGASTIPSKPKAASNNPTGKPKVGTTNQKAQIAADKKEGSKSTIIIIAVIVLLGAFIWAAISMGWFSKKQAPVIVETVVEEQPIDTAPEVEIIKEEPKVVEEPDQDPNAKKYYIVAGSFKVASNAERFNKKLMSEGYKSEIVERNNGFHTVSYKTTYNWKDALAEWKKMRGSNAETWILIR